MKPYMKPYPIELQHRAVALRKLGLGYVRIGKQLGVPPQTIRRWVDPQYASKQRALGRRRKQKIKGICVDCGAETHYSGKHGNNGASLRCKVCAQLTRKVWTKEAVIAAIQRWYEEHGIPPSSNQWLSRGEYWPPRSSVYSTRGDKAFRTWNEAIEAAGLTPRRRNRAGPGRQLFSRDKARELRETGMSDAEIGRRFDVSQSAIAQALGRRTVPRPTRMKRTREQRIADLRKALEREGAT